MAYGPVTCFWIEPTGEWVHSGHAECPAGHEHTLDLGTGPTSDSRPKFEDVAWPEPCPTCNMPMDYDDAGWRSTGSVRYYRRVDTGEVRLGIMAFGPGAMWDNALSHGRKGDDGRGLAVILPNGDTWHIDSRASNCGRPDDDLHRCWVRHGEVPQITVDKDGNTCPAGGGSIQAGDYHGRLLGGVLVEV